MILIHNALKAIQNNFFFFFFFSSSFFSPLLLLLLFLLLPLLQYNTRYELLSIGGEITYDDATVHLTNGLYVFVDRWLTSLPVNLLHFWHFDAYGLLYALFTVIYYLAGGKNGTVDYIYPMLDYGSAPGVAAGWIVGLAVVAAPLVQLLFWLMYLLREWLSELCFGSFVREYNNNRVGSGDAERGEAGVEGVENKAYENGENNKPIETVSGSIQNTCM